MYTCEEGTAITGAPGNSMWRRRASAQAQACTPVFKRNPNFKGRTPKTTGDFCLGLKAFVHPPFVQRELGGGPERTANRHLRLPDTGQVITHVSRVLMIVRRVSHVTVVVERHVERPHVLDIDRPEERTDVPRERNR